MTTPYEQIVRNRVDMTDWVIHFTRPAATGGGAPTSALQVLATILREGRLRPGWAPRNHGRTVYGPSAAICFTEQPLWAFKEYLDARSDPQHVSGYGLVLHKHDIFAAGALPVIYGIEPSNEVPRSAVPHRGQRLLDPAVLPEQQQYRYVSLALQRRPDPIDWTHEREWRLSSASLTLTDGALQLYPGAITGHCGAFKARVHVLVERDADVGTLRSLLAPRLFPPPPGALEDPFDRKWREHLRDKVRILSLERMQAELAKGSYEYARVETWPAMQMESTQ